MMSSYLVNAKEIAREAGEIMKHYFHAPNAVRIKADATPVTIADEKINAFVIERLGEHYPETSVIGEEGRNDKSSDTVWVCDPIDGTIPFTKHIPLSVFSLALVDRGVPVLGVVYDPFIDAMYTAEKGKGTYLNGKRLHVSSKKLGSTASIMMEWWGSCIYDVDTALHNLSIDTKTYILHLGSTVRSGCLVASGKSEANVFPGTKGKFVDAAAMKILVEEAGGKVTDLFGNDQRYDKDINGIVLSNGLVHDEVLAYIKKYSILHT